MHVLRSDFEALCEARSAGDQIYFGTFMTGVGAIASAALSAAAITVWTPLITAVYAGAGVAAFGVTLVTGLLWLRSRRSATDVMRRIEARLAAPSGD